MQKITNRADFFTSATYKTKLVEFKDRDFSVLVRELTQREIEEIGLGIKGDDENLKGKQALAVRWCAVDENMEQLFNKGDIKRLETISSSIITEISNAIFEISGVSQAKEEEKEEKN